MRIDVLLLLSLLSACSHTPAITARTEYFNEGYLASSRIETPDPCRTCFNGQQIVMNWNLQTRCLPATIVLSVRYGNHEFDEVVHEVNAPAGFWIFRLLNQEYWDRQGILSYSVRLYSGETLISAWNHHLWAEQIYIEGV